MPKRDLPAPCHTCSLLLLPTPPARCAAACRCRRRRRAGGWEKSFKIRSSGPGLCRTSRSRWSCLGQGRLWQIDSWVVLALPSWVLSSSHESASETLRLRGTRRRQVRGGTARAYTKRPPPRQLVGPTPCGVGRRLVPPACCCPPGGPRPALPSRHQAQWNHKWPQRALRGGGGLGFAVVIASTAPRAHAASRGGRRAP